MDNNNGEDAHLQSMIDKYQNYVIQQQQHKFQQHNDHVVRYISMETRVISLVAEVACRTRRSATLSPVSSTPTCTSRTSQSSPMHLEMMGMLRCSDTALAPPPYPRSNSPDMDDGESSHMQLKRTLASLSEENRILRQERDTFAKKSMRLQQVKPCR
jgi:hypothetical protein